MARYKASLKENSMAIFNKRNEGFNTLQRLDLHSLPSKQAVEIAGEQFGKIKEARVRGDQGVRLVQGLAGVEIVTGRGNHSVRHRSALKPAVMRYCDNNGIAYKEGNGHIEAFI